MTILLYVQNWARIIDYLFQFLALNGVLIIVFPIHIPPNKMGLWKGNIVMLLIWVFLFFLMFTCHLNFGIMPLLRPSFLLIDCLLMLLMVFSLSLSCLIFLRTTLFFVSLGAYVFLIFGYTTLTSFLSALNRESF